MSLPEFCPSDFYFGETMLGELEFIPLSSPSNTALPATVDDSVAEVMAENVINTRSTDFLGKSEDGFSHTLGGGQLFYLFIQHLGIFFPNYKCSLHRQQFNIFSMQKLREAGFIPVYNVVPSKVVIKKPLPQGGLEQGGFMTERLSGGIGIVSHSMSL